MWCIRSARFIQGQKLCSTFYHSNTFKKKNYVMMPMDAEMHLIKIPWLLKKTTQNRKNFLGKLIEFSQYFVATETCISLDKIKVAPGSKDT